MSRRPFNSVKYRKLGREISTDDRTTCVDGFVDEQFQEVPPVIPWKSVVFIGVLTFIGVACFMFALVIAMVCLGEECNDRLIVLSVVGLLTFIPGGYYTYVLVSVFFKRNNYTYNDIPSF